MSKDPEVGASGLMRSLLLSGWDPYALTMTKICVLFLLPEHHKFSDPESRLKAVLHSSSLWTMQTLVASARKPWKCSTFSQSSASQTRLRTRVDSHSVSMHHRGLIETENEHGVRLQNWRQRPWGKKCTGLGIRRPGLHLLTYLQTCCENPVRVPRSLLSRPWFWAGLVTHQTLFWLYYAKIFKERQQVLSLCG